MYAFVAMLWAPGDRKAAATATGWAQRLTVSPGPWENLLTTDGAIVLAQPPTDRALRRYELPEETGIVLGQLFSADLSKASLDSIEHIDERAAREIVKTGGRHLIRN